MTWPKQHKWGKPNKKTGIYFCVHCGLPALFKTKQYLREHGVYVCPGKKKKRAKKPKLVKTMVLEHGPMHDLTPPMHFNCRTSLSPNLSEDLRVHAEDAEAFERGWKSVEAIGAFLAYTVHGIGSSIWYFFFCVLIALRFVVLIPYRACKWLDELDL